MIYLKPLDTALLAHIFAHYDLVYTLEDGVIDGGLGSAVCEYAAETKAPVEIRRLGMPADRFVLHGPVEALHHQCGYAKEDLLDILRREM